MFHLRTLTTRLVKPALRKLSTREPPEIRLTNEVSQLSARLDKLEARVDTLHINTSPAVDTLASGVLSMVVGVGLAGAGIVCWRVGTYVFSKDGPEEY
jgi:hypothetical protein